VKAYVLIKTADGSAVVSEALRSMPGIDTVEEVTGPVDAIAVANVESADLVEGVLERIRELPGVLHVLPAPLIDLRSPLTTPAGVTAA
jgi:DNA-binding Lrp family transcriptional regulator